MSEKSLTSCLGRDQLVQEVIAANRNFYREISEKYDTYESCARDPFFQSMLEADLDLIASKLPTGGTSVHCLDCGGGTGNIALKLLRRGWTVTVVDVSAEMLTILRKRCQELGYEPVFVNDSLEQFFETCEGSFDLITFGSVLHHLYSYQAVLERAVSFVRAGGFLYTNFDPVLVDHPILARSFDTADTFLKKVRSDPSDVFPGIVRRLRKLTGRHRVFPDRSYASAGDLAEFHAKSGIDDEALLEFLCERGLILVAHSRYPYARNPILRRVNKHLCALQSFRLVCKRER